MELKEIIKAKVSALSAQIVETRRLSQSLPDPETPRDCIQNEIAAWQSISDEVQSHISALKTRQNELLPIHRLPVEVLAIILSTALPLGRYHRMRTRLLLVCRTWANAINTNPSTFWTTLSTDDPPSQYDRLLQMTRQMPVTVYMNYQSIKNHPSRRLMDAVRCKRLAFREVVYTGYDGKPIEEVLKDCVLAPTPHLRSLDIAVSRGSGLVLQNEGSDSQGTQVNFGAGSNLTSVRLSGVYIPWSATILRGLHSLSLAYLNMAGTNRSSPTLRDLLKILQGCPELRSLTLRYLTLCPDDQREAPTRISLGKLGKINLSGRSLRPTCDILQYIEYPRTAMVSVSDENRVLDDGWQVDIGVVLSQLTQNQIAAPIHLKIIRSRLTLSAINYQIDIPSPNEESAGSRITYREVLSSLDALTLSAVTSLHMGSSASQNSTAILMAANDLFPNLTKLSISPYQRLKSKKPWHVVLEKMVQSAEEVNRLRFLCPKLTSLEIATSDGDYPDFLSILQLVRTRSSDKKSKGKRVEKSPITAISMNLESGKLSSEQLGLLNELKDEVASVHCLSPL